MMLNFNLLLQLVGHVLREVPSDHGIDHAYRVLHHATRALNENCCAHLHNWQREAVLAAAMLHDVDDRKIVREVVPGRDPNHFARSILTTVVGHTAPLFDDITNSIWIDCVCEMISLVSASSNGNASLDDTNQLYKLIPRWADRIDALADNGYARCLEVTCRVGNAVFTEHTPIVIDNASLATIDLRNRFDAYVARGGSSASMMDHYYDKLLLLGDVPECQNPYLRQQLDAGVEFLRLALFGMNRRRLVGTLPRDPHELPRSAIDYVQQQ